MDIKNIQSTVSIASTIHSNLQEVADRQWVLLKTLELEYADKRVYGTQNTFCDSAWFDGEKLNDEAAFQWKKVVDRYGCVLSFLVKLYAFELRIAGRLEANSLKFKFYNLAKTILELIQNKRLIARNEGEYSPGLSLITDDDLLAMLDSRLMPATTHAAFVQECGEVAMFIEFANYFSIKIPFFEVTAQLPWIKAGVGVTVWATNRAADLDVMFGDGQGYAPIRSEILTPLINQSLDLLYNYADHFAEVSNFLRVHKSLGKKETLENAKALTDKIGATFNDILPVPSIKLLRGIEHKSVALIYWFRRIVYLARGACVNILLLTSGLRNSDIRGLKTNSCKSSGRVDVLYYLNANIQKTKNHVNIPVPRQAYLAVELLKAIKFSESAYLIDAKIYPKKSIDRFYYIPETEKLDSGDSLNIMIRDFAEHFNIPFIDPTSGTKYSAHNYRTTVAGWLDANSNLSILMIRRLFGHSNDKMPTAYLRNNPSFIQERKEQKARAAVETSRQMALAASQGRLAGVKGDQLIRGYQSHVSRFVTDPTKSHSLTSAEILTSFEKLIEQRILNESLCGFLTPFGVRCMRNPSDSTQAPCSSRTHRDKTKEIAEEIVNQLSLIAPENCIGTSCDQAMIGPWSGSLVESLLWYSDLLKYQLGNNFTDEHFRKHATDFIRQYASPIKKVFNIDVVANLHGSADPNAGNNHG